MDDMYGVSTWRLDASQGSGGASPMAEWSYPLPESSLWSVTVDDMYDVNTWRLVASQGSGGASPMAEWSYQLPESR